MELGRQAEVTERDISTVTAAAKITGDMDCSRNQDILALFKEGSVLNYNFCEYENLPSPPKICLI